MTVVSVPESAARPANAWRPVDLAIANGQRG
jgi:hypothetical protein